MALLIGADVELFAKQNKKFIALCDKIGGSKEHPLPVMNLNQQYEKNGFAVQEDNVSVEFNIPPAASAQQFTTYINAIKSHILHSLKGMNLTHSTDSSAVFEDDQLEHPTAQVFGCEPDYNAWTKTENEKPFCANKNLRTAGGHIHVGTSEVDMIHGIQMLDLYLGVPSILLDKSPASKERRQLYGKAGAMRPKPYGFEYRVLSNFWIWKPAVTRWVFTQTKKAMNDAHHTKITSGMAKEIQRIINEGDEDAAGDLIKDYGFTIPSVSV